MSERGLYEGFALNAVDDKGRVAIPAFLRNTIERNADGRTLILAKHETDPCLSAYDQGWSRLLHARISRQEQQALDAGGSIDFNVKRRAFGLVESVPFDASGRFILPGFFRAKAKITSHAFFYGWGDTFEIWSPASLAACETADADMQDACAWLMADRGIA